MKDKKLETMMHGFFGKGNVQQKELTTAYIAEHNLTVEQIVELIKDKHEIERGILHLSASDNQEIYDKIGQANNAIQQNRIDNFAAAVKHGVGEEYLAQFPNWTDKSSLKVDLQLANKNKDLDTEKLIGILEASIKQDILKKAKSEGFDTVEQWQANNAKKHNQGGIGDK